MKTPYKAALIGCGKIASQFAADPKVQGVYTHAAAYNASDKIQLVAVCDINETSARLCADRWHVPAYYTDVLEMLTCSRPDIVSICTPDATHSAMLEIVLSESFIKGVIIEKPIALDVSTILPLIAKARKNNVTILVNYNRRYALGHQKVKQYIENGSLGAVKSLSGYYTKGIIHNGTHWLDLARWLVGEVEIIQGFAKTKANHVDPTLDAWLQFKNGAIAYLHGLDVEDYSLFEMAILGTKGRICISHSGYNIEYFTIGESQYFTGFNTLHKQSLENDNVSNTLTYVVSDLIYAIENAKSPKCTDNDGLLALHIATELIKSSIIDNKIKLNIDLDCFQKIIEEEYIGN